MYIAHSDIAASALGAVAAGGGVYSFTADAAIAAGKTVYWDAGASKVTETTTGNKRVGIVPPGSSAAADGDAILVYHTNN